VEVNENDWCLTVVDKMFTTGVSISVLDYSEKVRRKRAV
jgi:hypothetical protein